MKTLAISPGHGSLNNTGAQYNGIIERDANMWISSMLHEMIEDNRDLGWTSKLLRKPNEDPPFHERARRAKDCDLVVCIHHDANPTSSVCGLRTYYWTGNLQGWEFANNIIRRAPTALYSNRRKPTEADSDWTRVRNVLGSYPQTSVLVECGFLTNYNDAESLKKESVQVGICLAVIASLVEF